MSSFVGPLSRIKGTASIDLSFPGYITGFKYTTCRSVYTSHTYIPPISERKASSDTVLLLNAINSTVYLNDSSLNRFSVMGNQTKWDFKSPYLVTA